MKNSIGHCLGCNLDIKTADVESQVKRAYRCQVSADGIITPIKNVEAQTSAVSFSVPDEMKVGLLAPDVSFNSNEVSEGSPAPAPGGNGGGQASPQRTDIKEWIKKNPLIAGGVGLGLLYFITKK